MKAREVKRAKMVAKYAEKRAKLKADGSYEALQALQAIPKMLLLYVCTTVALLQVVLKDISDNLVYPVFNLEKWLLKDLSQELKSKLVKKKLFYFKYCSEIQNQFKFLL